ncbi:MAG: RagB/SusD family nutrient uptake outer membrane protein [Bacteroidetes bacterium HGW-Bacteroidetes-13]|nr:MAG: RagB/SusD family nutrient uptake outer membrane protein [Bacteroidetes bacterium HGW-Bacteroidetes-13]
MRNHLKKLIFKAMTAFIVVIGFSACDGEVDLNPLTEETSESVLTDAQGFRQFAARVYAGFAVSGQQGPAGNPDISGIDEGFSNYLRQFWMHQELTTDEAIIAWNDGTIHDLNDHVWTPANEFVRAMYDRFFFQIVISNQFISQANAKLGGFSGQDQAEVQKLLAEVRFLRALSYWHAIDLYGNVPFVTDEDGVGAFLPQQGTRTQIYDYIVGELKAIEGEMAAPRQNEYGRADRGAVWMLLAKLYLNSEVYTGQARYTEALTELNKVVSAGYSLHANYDELFMADNDSNGAQNEVIYTVPFDGLSTQGFGGMTFLIHAPVGGNQLPVNFGINGGWGGLRATPPFVALFSDTSGNTDDRANFFTDGQTLEITDAFNFREGYLIEKSTNLTSTGQPGSDAAGNFGDADYPMFRLADAYLMYAEAVLRGGAGGDLNTALGFVNQIRQRAYGNNNGNITSGQLTLDFILDERGRELYWEGHRRTDLIRFGKFNSLIWPFKGRIQAGRPSEPFRKLHPIPSTDLVANPNLKQNPGY